MKKEQPLKLNQIEKYLPKPLALKEQGFFICS